MKLLTRQEEVALAERIEDGDLDARDEMVVRNLQLVHWVVQRFRGSIPYADLQQEGSIGLIKAARTFDRHRGFRFSTHAIWLIRAAISRFIEKQRSNSIEFDYEKHDTRTCPSGEGTADLKAAVTRSLRNLTPIERMVIALRFGFAGPELTLRDTGSALCLSHERVRQIQEEALIRLRGRWCELKDFHHRRSIIEDRKIERSIFENSKLETAKPKTKNGLEV